MPETENATPPQASSQRATLGEIATSAIRYWEPRRILYNAVLAAIVIGYYAKYLPASRIVVTVENILAAIVLAVLANVCYCAAYIVDIFVQFSDFRPQWLRSRWLLLTIGIAFAAILTLTIARDFFAHLQIHP